MLKAARFRVFVRNYSPDPETTGSPKQKSRRRRKLMTRHLLL